MKQRIWAAVLAALLIWSIVPCVGETSLRVDNAVWIPGQAATVRFSLPRDAQTALYVTDSAGNRLLEVIAPRQMKEGKYSWGLDQDELAAALAGEDTYRLLLICGEERAEGTLRVEGAAPTAQVTATPAPVQEIPTPIAAPTATPVPAAVITPAYRSHYHPAHENCYWCTPMDITDEAAVWAMLTAPVTVVDVGQRNQVILYEKPDENSTGIGVITGTSQSVHVLENRKDGWSLVECYSSSFHDSEVKNWNAFVTGYIQTGKLKTVTPRQDYGIVVDKLTQRLYLFSEGHLLTELMVSTGLYNQRQPYNETRSGEFLLVSKVGDFKSDNLVCAKALRFNSGDLLHEVPYTKNADGSANYKYCEPKLGTRASHGCIRVQRKRNAGGYNMTWLWEHLSLNTKFVVWEDYAGRTVTNGATDDTVVYYNPKGGTSYHSTAQCYGVRDEYKPLTAITYGQLEEAPFDKLTPCEYCVPPMRKAVIEAINEAHRTQSPGEIMSLLEQ